MAVNYEKYIQVLARSFEQLYAELARKQTDSYVVKASRKTDADDFLMGVAVPYRLPAEQIDGQLMIGFAARQKAVQLAGAIARHAGLPAVTELDSAALESLRDFFKKGAGRASAGWGKLGLAADLGHLSSLVDAPEDISTPAAVNETYIVTLRVFGESVPVYVTLKEITENVLMGKKVLVVDDSRMIRALLARAFKKQGCLVIEAVDGENAVEKFKEEQPDLTIMDMVMPHVDGFEAISRIRQISPQAKVLMLTSIAGKKEVMAAASLGISGYVKKPVKPEKLIATAANCFK